MKKYKDRNLIEEGYVDTSLISPYCVVQVVKLLDKMREYSLETYYHLVDVANLTKLVFEHVDLGLTETEKEEVYTAGLLHDVGKLSVPLELLHTKCDEQGKEFIQHRHIEATRAILEEMIGDENIINIAYHHHERMDGTGYPEGINRDKLSIQDRLVQVADVASAIMMPRSYRERYVGREDAARILRNNAAAGRLDGYIVEMMISALNVYNPTDEFVNDEFLK